MTVYYMKYDDGSLGSLETSGLPPTLTKPGVFVPEAEYTTLHLAQVTADAAAQAAIKATEATAYRLKLSGGVRTVASSQAPDHVKATAVYVCDGNDDQVQINQAITDALASTGGPGTVMLSVGDFNLSDRVVIPTSTGLTLAGSGGESVLRCGPAFNRFAIRLTGPGATSVTFQDFTIDGNLSGQTTDGGGIWAQYGVNCEFRNLRITGCLEECIHLGAVTGSVFGQNNIIEDCVFDGSSASTNTGHGVHVYESLGNHVTGCTFEDLGGATGQAAGIYDQSGSTFIEACSFTAGRAGVPAIRVKDTTATKILGCHFNHTGGDGVFLTGSGHVVADNTFVGVGALGTPGTVSGIHLEFAAKNNIVSGNSLATHTVNGSAHSLIREDADGSAGSNLFLGNMLVEKGTAQSGLLSLAGAASWVRDNLGAGPVGDEAPPVKVNAGPVSDASFPAARPPVSGTVAVDSTNNRLYVRVGSTWKYAALT